MRKRIRLSADYQCSPLWWDNSDMAGEIEPSTLPLTQETIDRLENWAKMFDRRMDLENAPVGNEPVEDEIEAFEQEGFKLWERIKKELKPDYEIVYNSKRNGVVLSDHFNNTSVFFGDTVIGQIFGTAKQQYDTHAL